MGRKGTFYIARLHKGGRLTHEDVVEALRDPPVVLYRDYGWTFTEYEGDPAGKWHYARLTKYRPEGMVTTVDHSQHVEVNVLEPDLVVAASPFVYLPEFSGVAYMHIWNQIQREVFDRRFSELVERAMDDFFATCQLEAISDVSSFVQRLAKMQQVERITATVHLPNPLFGPLWKSLSDYVESRNAESLKLDERGKAEGLRTRLQGLVEARKEALVPGENVGVTDAAVLMAADGYGSARVEGRSESASVIVRTSETQISFKHDREGEALELAARAGDMFIRHSEERGLSHEPEE